MKNKGKLGLVIMVLCLLVSVSIFGCSQGTPAPSPTATASPTPTSTASPKPAASPTPAATTTAVKPIELRLHHHDTPTSDRQKIFEEMVKRVDKATNGRVKITIYPSETLTKSKDAHDAVMSGIVDIAWCMTGVSPGRYNVLDLFNLPALGMVNSEMASMALLQIAKTFPAELQKELGNTKVIYLDTTAADIVGTKNKPIRKVADFQGLKLRAAGANATNHLKAMGAVPIMMSPGDIYTSVEKGVLDGWNMPWGGVRGFKLNEITKYFTETRNWVGPFFTLMNTDKYNSLPADVRDQMMSALGSDWTLWASRFTDEQEAPVKKFVVDGGGEIITLSAEERAKMQELAKPIWDSYVASIEAKGLPGKAILAEILKFAKEYKPAK